MSFVLWLRGLLAPMALLEGETGVAQVLTVMSQIITALISALSNFTTWILSDPLAIMFFAIMFIMLAIHLLHSLVHKFS